MKIDRFLNFIKGKSPVKKDQFSNFRKGRAPVKIN
jgi:hypothetical protein